MKNRLTLRGSWNLVQGIALSFFILVISVNEVCAQAPCPAPNNLPSPSRVPNQCGSQIKFTATSYQQGLTAVTIRWYDTSTGGSAVQSTPASEVSPGVWTSSYTTSAPSTSKTMYATLSGNGCSESTPRTPLTWSYSPASSSNITFTMNKTTICVGESVHLTAQGGSGYSWNSSPSDPSMIVSGPDNKYLDVSPATPTTYTVSGTTLAPCSEPDSYSDLITVKPTVSQISTPAGPSNVCQGTATSTYSASASSNVGSYDWHFLDPITGAVISTPGTLTYSTDIYGVSNATAQWNPAFTGSVKIRARAFSSGCSASTQSDYSVTVTPLPGAPTVSDVNAEYGITFSLLANGAASGESYKWYNAQGSVVPNTIVTSNLTSVSTTYYVSRYNTSHTTCETPSNLRTPQTVYLYLNLPPLASVSTNTCGPRSATFPSPPAGITYYWQGANPNGQNTDKPFTSTYTFNTSGPFYFRAKANSLWLWSNATTVSASSSTVDPIDVNVSAYDPANTLVQATHRIKLQPGFKVSPGSVFKGRIAITPECNNFVNWTESVAYNENAVPIASSKSYYDGMGRSLLDQSKDYLTKKVFAAQPLYNMYGDAVASTLPAPILEHDFIYKKDFVRNASGVAYTANDFDLRTTTGASGEVTNPKPVGEQPGTLGWYYSTSNNLESKTPVTDFPYARTFTEEGPGPTTSRSAGLGDAFRMGATPNHESTSERQLISAPDLEHYLSLRPYFVASDLPVTGYKHISKGTDGKKSVVFQDADGRTLASATLSETNIKENWSYNYYNDLGQLIASVAPKGVVIDDPASPQFVTTYKYDHLGRLIETTSPDEGTSKFVYSTDGKIKFSQNQEQFNADPQKFSYTNYDYLGRLVESGEYTSTTGGYLFEPQIAAPSDPLSVLHLIDVNIERGKDIDDLNPGVLATIFKGPSAKIDPARCSDYTFVKYDLPAGAPETQQNLEGQVSRTENKNTITYYSFDEFGQVIKTWQKTHNSDIADPEVKVAISYSYDYFGNVTQVYYQGDNTSDKFYHHYVYDLNNRLIEAYTSKDGTTKTLQAKYEYYLHGPLKRVALANNLQGIDYTYTIDGALKTINHADPAKDPGGDGTNDVFGETLHYFDGDYQGAGYSAGSQTITSADAVDQFGGMLKAMSWHSPAGNHQKQTYAYKYNDVNFLSNARFGDMTGTAGSYAFSPGNNYAETPGNYDKNGNIGTMSRIGKTSANILANYAYEYESGKNQLDRVNHDGALMVDYGYNAIGQMTEQIEGPSKTFKIKYNAYGLVKEIQKLNDAPTPIYVVMQTNYYDDRGNLFQKVFHDVNGDAERRTTYFSDVSGNVLAIYDQKNSVALASQPLERPVYAAGRVGVFKPDGNRYFYEVSDHLGNVRAVIGAPATVSYPTNFETASNPDFQNYTRHDDELMDHTDAGIVNKHSQILIGGYNTRVGLAKSIVVSPGDKVKVEAYAKYRNLTTNAVNLTGFTTALTSAFGLSSGLPGDPGKAYDVLEDYGTLIEGGQDHSLNGAPKAYINILLFDRNYNFVDAAYDQIDGNAEQPNTQTKTPHDPMLKEVTITEAGYAYIFLSNENLTQIDVHFDDVTVTHTQSTIVAGADYYPFGLVMENREITDEPYRYGYQGQFSEENDSTGWNEFELRNYEPRIGRWLSTDPYGQFHSPYVGMGNNPHMGVDPDGGYFSMFSWQGSLIGAAVGAGIGLAFDKDNWGWYALGGAAAGGFLASDFAKVEIWGTHRGLGNADALYGGGRENIARINHMNLKYQGNFQPNYVSVKTSTPPSVRDFKPRALPSLVNTTVKARFPRITTRTITQPVVSAGYSDQGLNEGYGADNVASTAHSIYQRQNQLGFRNVKITFTSAKPTLAVRNYVQRIIRKLTALGVPRKDIIEEVVPVKNYGDPKFRNDQLHTNVSGQFIRIRD
jgi:RHS repeat-associated protein